MLCRERETYERRLQQNTDMLTKEHSSYEANKMNMLNSAAIARGIDLPADGSFEHNFNLILKHVKMVDSESEKTRAENLQKAETALKESTIAHLEHVCVAMRLPSETFDSIPNLVKHIHHKALSLQDERDDLAHKVRDLSTSSESVKESIRQLVHHINTGHIIPVSQSTDATIKLLETTINQHYTTKLLAHDQDVRNEVLSTIKKACPRLGVAIKEPGNTSQLVEVFVDTVINKHDETAADCKDLVNHITQETEQRGFILHTGSNEKLKHYVVDLLTQIDKQTTATENNTQAVRDAKEQSDSTMSRIQQKIVKSSQTLLLPNPDMEADTETIVKTYVSAVTARVKKLLAERNDLDAHINRVITDISGMAMSDAKVIEAFKIVQELYDRIDALDKHLVATAKVLPPAPLQPSQNSTIERCTDYLASLETKVRELEKDEVTLNNEFDSVMRHCWSDTAAISDMSPQQRSTALIKEFDLRKTQKAELESIIDRSIKRLNQETQQPGIPSVGDMKLDERISAVLRALSDRLGVERESLKVSRR
jgi:predicted  nucleic acid-binding Zn-ribbon protein